jgi:uridine kinase
MLAAAVEQCNAGPVSIGESIGSSIMISLPKVSAEIAALLNQQMQRLIAQNIDISCIELSRADALQYFSAKSQKYSVEYIQSSSDSSFKCNSCHFPTDDGASVQFLSLFRGPLLSSMGSINPAHFDVRFENSPYPHIRIQHACQNHIQKDFSLMPTEEVVLIQAFAERKVWGENLNFDSISKINSAICDSKGKYLVQMCEALHDRQVVNIADRITCQGTSPSDSCATPPRLVLIAGPSSSGKTTFAKRLCVALETNGIRPVVLSVDSYYKAWQDIDERGMSYVDWESLRSLNLDLLNEHLIALLNGEEVLVPEYDMRTSMPMSRDHWTRTKLESGGLIIMEGIHCLNPELTPKVDSREKFRIMISPISPTVIDDHNIVSSSQVRMLRRMVRDFLFRGRSAISTLKQWPSVALGERQNIYPNQNFADVVMNSALVYETHVLKVYAEPLLKAISPDAPEYPEARRLLSLLDLLLPMPNLHVPPQSLLREFIGGSWFYDFGGMFKNA